MAYSFGWRAQLLQLSLVYTVTLPLVVDLKHFPTRPEMFICMERAYPVEQKNHKYCLM
jgi:hypothetical protein